MAEGLLLFLILPKHLSVSFADSSPPGEPPCLPWRGGAAAGGGEVVGSLASHLRFAAAKPCFRSAMISSMCSVPMERRIVFGLIP